MKIIFTLTLLLFSQIVFSEFNYSSYTPLSIQEASSKISKEILESDYFYESAIVKHKVVVKYTGKLRASNEKLKTFIGYWVKALNLSPQYVNLFPFEVEIEEKNKKYWLPIQTNLVKPFEKEVSPNSNVELYIMLLGGYKNHPVFSINEFSAK